MQCHDAYRISTLFVVLGVLGCSEPVSPDQVQVALAEYLNSSKAPGVNGKLALDPMPFALLPTPELQQSCPAPSALSYVRYEQSHSSYTCVNERCTLNIAVAGKIPRCVHGWACVTRDSSGVKITKLDLQAWTGEIPIQPGKWSIRVMYGPENLLLKEGSIRGLWRGVEPDVALHSTTKYYPETNPIRITRIAAGRSEAAPDGTDFGQEISYLSPSNRKDGDLQGLIAQTDVYLDIDLEVDDAAIDRTVDLLYSFKVRVPRLNAPTPLKSGEPYPVPKLGHTYYVDTHYLNDQMRIRIYSRNTRVSAKAGDRIQVQTEDMAHCRKAAY